MENLMNWFQMAISLHPLNTFTNQDKLKCCALLNSKQCLSSQIDLTQPLEPQGPFDVIVHKLSDVIVEAEHDSKSQQMLTDFQVRLLLITSGREDRTSTGVLSVAQVFSLASTAELCVSSSRYSSFGPITCNDSTPGPLCLVSDHDQAAQSTPR